ncbi:hypothetical protein J3R30DRAFT_578607 [Lentinula aciculospora]|uniref:Uncharacterized protein n=1 Tax=Lentinula aciculospora TaxID=153920 RepID=A0A9W9A917_9AGAR|nr:hypothetical protein J3R30DRAFT_578607 [Lentinula aciculospora]
MSGYPNSQTFISGPSLFPVSTSTIINGGIFKVYGDSKKKQKLGSRHSQEKRIRVKVIPRHQIHFQREVRKCRGSRFSSAMRKGSEVIVQTFEGTYSHELWEQTLDFASSLVNAHLLNLIGSSSDKCLEEISDEPHKDPHYLVFDGRSCRNTHHLLASLLRSGSMQTTLVGMHMVNGIASGLDYLLQQHSSFKKRYLEMWCNSHNSIGNDFTLFSNDLGHTTIAFTPEPSPKFSHSGRKESETPDMDEEMDHNRKDPETLGEHLCATLIQMTFDDANRLIYMDEPKRDYMPWNDLDDLMANPSSSTAAGLGKGIQGISRSALSTHPSKKLCRREIVWRSYSEDGIKASLASIARSYQDLLDSLTVADSDMLTGISLPQCRNLPMLKMPFDAQCFCGGYSWEEIILKPDPLANRVLTYRLCWRCCFD